MAYISTEKVKNIRQNVKKMFPKPYKFSVTREHHSTVNIKLMEGPLDLEQKYEQLNDFYPENHKPEIANIIRVLNDIVEDQEPNYDRFAGDMGADYPDWNYHKSFSIGKWDKEYKQVVA